MRGPVRRAGSLTVASDGTEPSQERCTSSRNSPKAKSYSVHMQLTFCAPAFETHIGFIPEPMCSAGENVLENQACGNEEI